MPRFIVTFKVPSITKTVLVEADSLDEAKDQVRQEPDFDYDLETNPVEILDDKCGQDNSLAKVRQAIIILMKDTGTGPLTRDYIYTNVDLDDEVKDEYLDEALTSLHQDKILLRKRADMSKWFICADGQDKASRIYMGEEMAEAERLPNPED